MTDSNKSTSPLRQRMIDDMTLRKLSPRTQAGYLRAVVKFTRFFGQSPDLASPEDLRAFQLHLVEQGTSSTTINATLTGLTFLFGVTATPCCHRHYWYCCAPGGGKAMRSAALGGHLLCCKECAQVQIAYNSCRNRHCPKCQGSAARRWLQDRQGDLLPVDYYHVVFTLPAPISDIAYHNKAVIYDLLFKATAETLLTIAADPKRPFAGPEAVLAYLARYTHRIAISNSRLIACDQRGVIFKWKDYRARPRDRYKTLTLATDEFIRRFLIHVLPAGFHRIRHYGLFANHTRVKHVQRLRELLNEDSLDAGAQTEVVEEPLPTPTYTCQVCGAPMIIIETFEKQLPRASPVYP